MDIWLKPCLALRHVALKVYVVRGHCWSALDMPLGLACGVVRGYRESSGSWRPFGGRSPIPHSGFWNWEILCLQRAKGRHLTWVLCSGGMVFTV